MPVESLSVLLSERAIEERIDQLAERISADYAAADAVVMVGVLKGAFVFLADLARRLTVPSQIDFVCVASYGDSTASSGDVRFVLDARTELAGRHVLIVEDIVDTGHTVAALRRALERRHPASLKCCALLDKRSRRQVEVAVEYVGFEVPDVWVVGYGLDHAERHRALPHVAALDLARA